MMGMELHMEEDCTSFSSFLNVLLYTGRYCFRFFFFNYACRIGSAEECSLHSTFELSADNVGVNVTKERRWRQV